MTQHVRGVVARSKGAPVTVETVLVPDPGPGEAVVKIQACGVCHTDLHYRDGAINDDFPFLLGHEAAGVVERSARGPATWRPATSSSSTGEPSAGSAGPAAAVARGTASPPTTPPSA